MEIRPVAGALGAEVSGVDAAAGVDEAKAARLRTALFEHQVLFFRDQGLSPDSQLEFARVFGEPDIYPFIEGLPGTPEVIEILKTETDTKNFGGGWHSDTAYLDEPAIGTVLYAVEVPAAGGDTLFASTVAAYEALSPGMQAMLGELRGVNSSERGYDGGRAAAMARMDGMRDRYKQGSGGYEAEHPVVRTHPETGKRSLFVNRAHTIRFAGMTEAESKPLIDFLCEHVTRPEFTCRLRWRPGTVAVWDNRTTQHAALNDYQGKRRRMHRVTLKGERPS